MAICAAHSPLVGSRPAPASPGPDGNPSNSRDQVGAYAPGACVAARLSSASMRAPVCLPSEERYLP